MKQNACIFSYLIQRRNEQEFEVRTASYPTNVTTNLDVSPDIPQIVHNYVSKHRVIWLTVSIKSCWNWGTPHMRLLKQVTL
jgi:hypothetical protein